MFVRDTQRTAHSVETGLCELYEAALIPGLPEGWADLTRDPAETRALGREWLEAGEQLAMRVPSVVCPSDFNLLLNPMHPEMARVKVISAEPFTLDPRLFGQATR